MAKVNWKVASSRRVVGGWVQVKSLEEIEARVKPRKYSQAGADEINAWAVSRSKFKRDSAKANSEAVKEVEALIGKLPEELTPEIKSKIKVAAEPKLLEVLADSDPEMLKQSGYMALVIRYGIAEYQFGDEEGKPDDAWISDVLDNVELASELLLIAQGFNAPLASPTSDTSETSQNGNSKE